MRAFSVNARLAPYMGYTIISVADTALGKMSQSEFNKFTAAELNEMTRPWAWRGLDTATQSQLGDWLNANPTQMAALSIDALRLFSTDAVRLVTDKAASRISGDAWMAWIKADMRLLPSGLLNLGRESHGAHVLKPSAFTLFSQENLADLAGVRQTITWGQFSHWITSHKAILVRELDANVFLLFNGGILNNLGSEELGGLKATQVAQLRRGEISTLNAATINLLSPKAIAGFTASQIAAIDAVTFADWAVSRINALTADQLAGITSRQVAVLGVDAFKALDATTLNGMSGAWEGITVDQIQAIPDAVFCGLSATSLNRLTLSAASAISFSEWVGWFNAEHCISELSPNLIEGLPMTFVELYTPKMVKAMSLDQIKRLGGWFGALSVDCLQALSGSQWSVVSSIGFASLTTQKVASLGPQAWRNLSKEAISTLAPEKVKVISPSHLALIPADSFTVFSLQAVNSMTKLQIESLSSGQITALNLSVSSSEYMQLDQRVQFSLAERGFTSLPNRVQTWRGESRASLLDLSLIATASYAVGADGVSEEMVIKPPPSWILLDQKLDAGLKVSAWQCSGTIVIGIAGTDDWNDIAADFDLFGYVFDLAVLDEFSRQVCSAVSFYDQLKRDNPEADFIFTGHSLGGGLSSAIGVLMGTTALAFDEAPVMGALQSDSFVSAIKTWLASNGASLTPDTVSILQPYVSGSKNDRNKFINSGAKNISAVRVSGEILDMVQDAGTLATLLFPQVKSKGKDGRVAVDIFEYGASNPSIANLLNILGEGDLDYIHELGYDILQRHQYVPLVAAAASSDFRRNLASLGLMSGSLYTNSPSSFDMIMRDFAVKYGEGQAEQSKLIKWSADLTALGEHNGVSSTAWRVGTALSTALIGASAYDYAFGSQSSRPNIFSGIAGGVLAKFSAVEEDNVDLENIREIFHSQVRSSQTDVEILDLVGQRIEKTQNWAVQNESGMDLVFDAASLEGNIAVLGGVKGGNYLKGGMGDMVAVVGGGQNWMFGGSGDDVLVGGNGVNYFDGGGGNNVLVGGAGMDVFAFSSNEDRYDVIHNFSQADGDVLDFRGLENSLGLKFSFNGDAPSSVAKSPLGAMWFDASQQALFVNTGLGSGQHLAARLVGVTSVMTSSIFLGNAVNSAGC